MELKADPLIRTSIVAIMLFQVAALFARSFWQIELLESGIDATFAKHLSYLIVPAILLVLMWPILWSNRGFLRWLFRSPKSWPKLIIASVGLAFALRLGWWTTLFAASSFGWLDTTEAGSGIDLSFYVACPPQSVFLLSIFVMSILTPLDEEIINRGLILGSLSQKDPRTAVVLSAILFAILHEPSAIPNAFIFGLFAAIQIFKYKTLWAPIITHSTYNFLTVIDWECLHASWTPEEPTTDTIFIGVIATAAGLACLSLAIWIVAYARAGTD